MAKQTETIVATATEHPYLTAGVLIVGAIAGIIIVSDLFSKSSKATTEPVQTGSSTGIEPYSMPTTTQATTPTSTITPSTTQMPEYYTAPAPSTSSSMGVSAGFVGGSIISEPYEYIYSPSSYSNTSSEYSSTNISNITKTNNISQVYSPQTTVTVNPSYENQQTTSFATSGTFAGINYGSPSSFFGGVSQQGGAGSNLGGSIGSFFSNSYKTASSLLGQISSGLLKPASFFTNGLTTGIASIFNPEKQETQKTTQATPMLPSSQRWNAFVKWANTGAW